jgi:DNA-binding NarL/FixJ family response regulator
MIRVALIDDHPALVAGLSAILQAEPGIVPVGTASDAAGAEHLLYRTQPDVVMIDHDVRNSLRLCRAIKSNVPAPRVLIYSPVADSWLGFAARAAGADGLASKHAPARELFETIRRVAGGEVVLPPIAREHLLEGAARVDDEDLGLLSMLIDGTPPRDIAETLRIPFRKLSGRMDRVLARLRVDVPAPVG